MLAFALVPPSPRRGALSLDRPRRDIRTLVVLAAALLAACGGGDADPPPPPETGGGGVVVAAPTITTQPADTSVGNGQPASFSVAASGTAPLQYQWRRNGADVAGATATTYSVAAVALADSGAAYSVIVSNAAGTVTSRNAVLTVTVAAPVLTITQQPADSTVSTGSSATFSVAATCSSGTLAVQWQRAAAGASAFADLAGATATTYNFTTAAADTGARFRAQLNCSGQAAATSAVAVVTVGMAQALTLASFTVTGLGNEADIGQLQGIVQDAGGSWSFTTGQTRIRRLRADLSGIDIVAGTGASGNADGPTATATFAGLIAIARDDADTLYVAQINGGVRKVGPTGDVTTVLAPGALSGTFNPTHIAVGPDGDLYLAAGGSQIYRLTMAGVLSVYAGSGFSGFADGPANAAQFARPSGLAIAVNGDLYVADRDNHRIRRILRAGNAAGNVETLAGNGTPAVLPSPYGVGLRGSILAVRDELGVKEIDVGTGTITPLAGATVVGLADGQGSAARFRTGTPSIAPAPAGGWLVAESTVNPSIDYSLRTVSASGDVRTLARSIVLSRAPIDGTALLAQAPLSVIGLAIDSGGRVVVGDARADVRRIEGNGSVGTIAGLANANGSFDGTGSTAQFNSLPSLVGAPGGVIYVADRYRIRRIAADNTVSTVAGDFIESGNVNGNGAAGRFSEFLQLAMGPGGDLYVGDAAASAVRRVDAGGNVTQYTAIAGVRRIAFAADGTLYATTSTGSLLRRSADLTQTTTVAGPNVSQMDVDPATGTVYYLDAAGALFAAAPGGTPQLLLPKVAGPSVLGTTNPSLGSVGEIRNIRYRAPKQLVIANTVEGLLLVTVP